MGIFGRKRRDSSPNSTDSTPTVVPELTKDQVKRATRTRKIWALLTSFFLFVTVIFLILVEIGGTHNRHIIRNWYFLKIDVANIIPVSIPDFALINTIAQTLGLHDFYQVGLWGFCEGYKDQGVTNCSKPETLYWFNPVAILRNELLAGASINLPSKINNTLHLIKIASHIMFGFFLTGACLSFALMFLMPISIISRWWTLAIAILAFINALIVTAATVIATVMFVIFRNVVTEVKELNIGAKLGSTMFAFMWVATAFSIIAWLVQSGLCCCCASRRDVKTGRKRGSEKAYGGVLDGVYMRGANGEEANGKHKWAFWKRND